VDGHQIKDFKQLVDFVHLRADEPMTVGLLRKGVEQTVVVTPLRVNQVDPLTHRTMQVGQIGVGPSRDPADYIYVHYNPVDSVVWGANQTWDIVATTVTYIGRIVSGRESANQLSSFLGMAQQAGAVAKAGADSAPDMLGKTAGVTINLLSFAAVVSTAVGFMNLLPLPVLDGGHITLSLIEWIRRRPSHPKILNYLQNGFAIALISLMAYLAFFDVVDWGRSAHANRDVPVVFAAQK